MGAAFGAEVVVQRGRTVQHRLYASVFAVEDAQRVGSQTAAAVVIQRVQVVLQVGNQRLLEGVAFFGKADGIQLQRQQVKYAQAAKEVGADGDEFGVKCRTCHAEGFDAHLRELAAASFLRAFVAEHWPFGIDALRLLQFAVLDHRPHHACGRFRAQGDAFVVAVAEGVHFFADDVGFFADGTLEQAGLFKERQL